MSAPRLPPLLVLPDVALAPEHRWIDVLRALRQRLPPGALGVQVRSPGASAAALLRWGQALRQGLGEVPLLVNDRVDVAVALGAQGVHLGRQSMGVGEARSLLGPGCWVTRACHDAGELEQAAREGADAGLLSPVFASPGKGPPLGLGALRGACAAFPTLAVLALGGVDARTAPACLGAGARGVAVIRAALDVDTWHASSLRLAWPASS